MYGGETSPRVQVPYRPSIATYAGPLRLSVKPDRLDIVPLHDALLALSLLLSFSLDALTLALIGLVSLPSCGAIRPSGNDSAHIVRSYLHGQGIAPFWRYLP